MTMTSDFGVGGETRLSALTVSETFWGYVIREPQSGFDSTDLMEAVMRFLGIVLVFAAGAQWMLPGALFTGDVIAMKIMLTFFFTACGAALYWYGGRSFRVEVQIDTTRREIRIAGRNSRDYTRLHKRIPMAEVDSTFVKRSGDAEGSAHLLVRLAGEPDPLHLATGKERELRTLHSRLRHDLQPVRDRVERRLAARDDRRAAMAREVLAPKSTA